MLATAARNSTTKSRNASNSREPEIAGTSLNVGRLVIKKANERKEPCSSENASTSNVR
jgi:hypothetical protein